MGGKCFKLGNILSHPPQLCSAPGGTPMEITKFQPWLGGIEESPLTKLEPNLLSTDETLGAVEPDAWLENLDPTMLEPAWVS